MESGTAGATQPLTRQQRMTIRLCWPRRPVWDGQFSTLKEDHTVAHHVPPSYLAQQGMRQSASATYKTSSTMRTIIVQDSDGYSGLPRHGRPLLTRECTERSNRVSGEHSSHTRISPSYLSFTMLPSRSSTSMTRR